MYTIIKSTRAIHICKYVGVYVNDVSLWRMWRMQELLMQLIHIRVTHVGTCTLRMGGVGSLICKLFTQAN